MKPSQISTFLRRIAAKIDSSKRPDRRLVAADVRRVLAAMDYSVSRSRVAGKVFDLLADLYGVTSVEADMTSRMETISGPDGPVMDEYKSAILETFDKVFGTNYRNDISSFIIQDPDPSFIYHELLHHAMDPGFLESQELREGKFTLDETADESINQFYQFHDLNLSSGFGQDLGQVIYESTGVEPQESAEKNQIVEGLRSIMDMASETPGAALIKKAVSAALHELRSMGDQVEIDDIVDSIVQRFQRLLEKNVHELKDPAVEANLKKWFLLLRRKVDSLAQAYAKPPSSRLSSHIQLKPGLGI